jgi:hypothetical protein
LFLINNRFYRFEEAAFVFADLTAHFTTETVLATVYPPFYKLLADVLRPFHRILERASVSPAAYFTLMHEKKIAPAVFRVPAFTHDVPFSLLAGLLD